MSKQPFGRPGLEVFCGSTPSHNCFALEGGSNSVIWCEELENYRVNRIDTKTLLVTDRGPVAGNVSAFDPKMEKEICRLRVGSSPQRLLVVDTRDNYRDAE